MRRTARADISVSSAKRTRCIHWTRASTDNTAKAWAPSGHGVPPEPRRNDNAHRRTGARRWRSQQRTRGERGPVARSGGRVTADDPHDDDGHRHGGDQGEAREGGPAPRLRACEPGRGPLEGEQQRACSSTIHTHWPTSRLAEERSPAEDRPCRRPRAAAGRRATAWRGRRTPAARRRRPAPAERPTGGGRARGRRGWPPWPEYGRARVRTSRPTRPSPRPSRASGRPASSS